MTFLDFVLALSFLCALAGAIFTIAAIVAGGKGDDKLR